MLIFVDCEARGTSPVNGTLTEFGCVSYPAMQKFHGVLFESTPDPDIPAIPVVGARVHTDEHVARMLSAWLRTVSGGQRVTMVSDNPAFDFMWIAGMYDRAGLDNPFGHSARRIGDFYAGVMRKWSDAQSWKRFRKTKHDHNPVHDALGNVEAYDAIMDLLEKPRQEAPEWTT